MTMHEVTREQFFAAIRDLTRRGVDVNPSSSANLRTLTPLGAHGLFIVQREDAPGDPWPHIRFSRYTPPGGAHIIPTPPSVLGNRP